MNIQVIHEKMQGTLSQVILVRNINFGRVHVASNIIYPTSEKIWTSGKNLVVGPLGPPKLDLWATLTLLLVFGPLFP